MYVKRLFLSLSPSLSVHMSMTLNFQSLEVTVLNVPDISRLSMTVQTLNNPHKHLKWSALSGKMESDLRTKRVKSI